MTTKLIEIRPAKAKRLTTPWGRVITSARPVRVPPTDRLAEYARKSPRMFICKEIDVEAEARRNAAPTPKPLRRRQKAAPQPAPKAERVETPVTRSDLVKQLGKDNRAALKERAEEFGLLVASGATKAELKSEILAAFDARASATEQGDQPDPS